MDCTLIGAPLQIGAGQLGCEMGPSALRIAGLRTALEELGQRRDFVADQLLQLQRHQRGTNAYLQAMG